MKLIVGLGNPGEKYTNTRHNVGFLVLNKLITDSKLNSNQVTPFRLENQFKAEVTQTGGIGEDRVIFAKPQTFMNLSGEAVSKLMQYYKIGCDDIVIICDDLDLPLGTIRVRLEGSSGGHNGLQSIINFIGSRFIRIRIGIGSNRQATSNEVISNKVDEDKINIKIPAEEYVLQNFTKDDMNAINKSIDKVVEILLEWINTKELDDETIKITE
jgi:PTH1 family peptidyl-tRNA hydrolase